MRLVRIMHDLEAISSRIYILIGYDPVANDVDVAFDLDFGFAIATQAIEMGPLKDKIARLPCIVSITLLSQPTVVIRGSDLVKNACTRFER